MFHLKKILSKHECAGAMLVSRVQGICQKLKVWQVLKTLSFLLEGKDWWWLMVGNRRIKQKWMKLGWCRDLYGLSINMYLKVPFKTNKRWWQSKWETDLTRPTTIGQQNQRWSILEVMFVKQKGLKGPSIHQVSYPNLGIRRTSEWKSDHHHPHHNDTLILIIILMAIVILIIILIIIATGQWRIPKSWPQTIQTIPYYWGGNKNLSNSIINHSADPNWHNLAAPSSPVAFIFEHLGLLPSSSQQKRENAHQGWQNPTPQKHGNTYSTGSRNHGDTAKYTSYFMLYIAPFQ